MPRSQKYVAYYRVSTVRQGTSGLGLEAQQEAVRRHLCDVPLLAEFTEVESGAKRDRPQLERALRHCRITGATLLIAKLDRLSRNAHFLLGLQEAGVKFVAADMPEANEMVVGIMAVMAQHEREMISKRTKEALAAARARGTMLGAAAHAGGPRVRQLLGKGYHQLGGEATRRNALTRATQLQEILEDIAATGVASNHAIATELNRRQIMTPRGGQWHAASVWRVRKRLAELTDR